jgi:hypothetical protein
MSVEMELTSVEFQIDTNVGFHTGFGKGFKELQGWVFRVN